MCRNFFVRPQILSISFFLLSSCVIAQAPQAQPKSEVSPNDLVNWSSDEGIRRLERSHAKVDFFPLVNHFETQANKLTCGPTSSTIILNTLRLGKETIPQDPATFDEAAAKYLPKDFDPHFRKYTQNTFFSGDMSHSKSRMEVLGQPMDGKSDYGLQLRQLAKSLEAHGLNVALRIVDDKLARETIKRDLIKNLSSRGDYVLVNYARKSLGQKGGGHISPLGAYDEESDSFLILDVNPNTAPFVWVKSDLLIDSMKTFDTIENRGYLLISDRN